MRSDEDMIYVASKSEHASMWQGFRMTYPIVASWIDDDGEDLEALWLRCVQDVRDAVALVAYHEAGEQWKGAFVEIGVALGSGIPVWLAGDPPGSWVNHPSVHRVASPHRALELATEYARSGRVTEFTR